VSETRERILETARGLFNQQGLHRVGVRDVARAVGMSPGNLAYHFATKDALVEALVLELYELNAREVFAELPGALSLLQLYQSAVAVMRNLLRYRFILLSYADAVRASPQLQAQQARLLEARRARHERLVAGLARGGYLQARRVAPRTELLFEQSELISSGWLSAATLRGWRDDQATILHFAKVGMALMEPYCTLRGLRQLRQILAGAHDPRSTP
jgi:AcrR family transcriptional regulator